MIRFVASCESSTPTGLVTGIGGISANYDGAVAANSAMVLERGCRL
jgi:hypothetical protein